ncbi:MAG TPA: SPOR domain-containing protein [Clostridiales bacterium]|nr:SPOR domain-containing protein [Clostridiales bacterium]
MRYSRIKRNQTKKRYATFLLVVLLGFAVIYVAFAGTLGKFVSNLILPLISSENKNNTGNNDDDPVLTIPDTTEEPSKDTAKVTETLKANALTMYAIQMNAFSDKSNAEAFAQELKSKGGAGYILDDGFYRVIAIGFKNEQDAKQVREELKADGIESHVYKIATAGANMSITATRDNVSAISSAYELWEEKYYSLEDIILNLDKGNISSSEAYNNIKEIKTELEAKRDQLKELYDNQNNNNIVLAGLVTLYENSCLSLDKILSINSMDKVAISSEIKYTYVDMLMQYMDYMEQITK